MNILPLFIIDCILTFFFLLYILYNGTEIEESINNNKTTTKNKKAIFCILILALLLFCGGLVYAVTKRNENGKSTVMDDKDVEDGNYTNGEVPTPPQIINSKKEDPLVENESPNRETEKEIEQEDTPEQNEPRAKEGKIDDPYITEQEKKTRDDWLEKHIMNAYHFILLVGGATTIVLFFYAIEDINIGKESQFYKSSPLRLNLPYKIPWGKLLSVGIFLSFVVSVSISVCSHRSTTEDVNKENPQQDIQFLKLCKDAILKQQKKIRMEKQRNETLKKYILTNADLDEIQSSSLYKNEIKQLSELPKFLEFRGVWKVTGQKNTVYIRSAETDNNIHVDWGDGSVEPFKGAFPNDIDFHRKKIRLNWANYKYIKHTYKNDGSYTVRIWGVMKHAQFRSYSNDGADGADLISVKSLGYLHWENFYDMFAHCKELTTVEGGFTHKVTDMTFVFFDAKNSVPNVTSWKTYKVTDMSYMFGNAKQSKPNTSLWKLQKDCKTVYIFNNSGISNPQKAEEKLNKQKYS